MDDLVVVLNTCWCFVGSVGCMLFESRGPILTCLMELFLNHSQGSYQVASVFQGPEKVDLNMMETPYRKGSEISV